MENTGRILLHLAAVLAGWGIVQSQKPASPETAGSMAPGKASIREARDRVAGEKLLRRLVPDLAPAPPVEVRRHEGTLEERVKKMIEDDPFAPYETENSDENAISHFREEIQTALSPVDGPDLSYAFQKGRLEARQVLATLQDILPDLGGEALFAKAVFLELCQIDPFRAADLLDGLAPGERASWLMDGFSSSVITADPFASEGRDTRDPATILVWTDLAVSTQLDADEMFSGGQGQILYNATVFWNEYGDDYPDWLLDQAPTKGREILLNAWVSLIEDSDPAAAAAWKERLSTR